MGGIGMKKTTTRKYHISYMCLLCDGRNRLIFVFLSVCHNFKQKKRKEFIIVKCPQSF